jgi:hypothetical protein
MDALSAHGDDTIALFALRNERILYERNFEKKICFRLELALRNDISATEETTTKIQRAIITRKNARRTKKEKAT